MSTKKLSFLAIFFLLCFFLSNSRPARAAGWQETLSSGISRIQENLEYFFAFKVEKRVGVLEKHAEKRLSSAQFYSEANDSEKVQVLLGEYLDIKDRQDKLLVKTFSGDVLGAVASSTIEQQKTMEEIKTKVDEDVKQVVVQTQEQVVNQVAKRVVVVNGEEGQTEFFQEVSHVWAPGTGPGGGESGVVIEGGAMKFAPGTEGGGEGTLDIQTVVVVSSGDEGVAVD